MKIDWVILAEGNTSDARGAMTLVGVGQNVVETSEVPLGVSRVVAFGVSSDVPAEADLVLEILNPAGEALVQQRTTLRFGERERIDVPLGAQMAAMFNVVLEEYGVYIVRCTVHTKADKSNDSRELKLHVLPTTPPPELPSAE